MVPRLGCWAVRGREGSRARGGWGGVGTKCTPPPPTVRTSAFFTAVTPMPLSVSTTPPLTDRSCACPFLFGPPLLPRPPPSPADAGFMVVGAAYAAVASPICAAAVGGTRLLKVREATLLWYGGGARGEGGGEPLCIFDYQRGLWP